MSKKKREREQNTACKNKIAEERSTHLVPRARTISFVRAMLLLELVDVSRYPEANPIATTMMFVLSLDWRSLSSIVFCCSVCSLILGKCLKEIFCKAKIPGNLE